MRLRMLDPFGFSLAGCRCQAVRFSRREKKDWTMRRAPYFSILFLFLNGMLAFFHKGIAKQRDRYRRLGHYRIPSSQNRKCRGVWCCTSWNRGTTPHEEQMRDAQARSWLWNQLPEVAIITSCDMATNPFFVIIPSYLGITPPYAVSTAKWHSV